ncbi:STAS domain-containing protein [Caldisalinibacter kiritimatiensis]|uniref:Anti-sigma factor antagonist n=1 Tax=Caldisalinibacter kiritimatiensis TaxID=1304284 RepID=R1CL67_9FIRM|nr:STAS domain-containing protein [Caldisalinibacter kiritimatiensis]EOC99440.1 Anti-sigma F factor antagonist (spoIIAA-2) / Anti-sigma B factor antagonist RsbV [Caldisalinibacter kiritimatiensis]
MALKIIKNYDENKNCWIIKPIGEIDIYTSPEFKETLLDLIEKKNIDIVVDGEKLDYIDSTGLGVLISALKKAKENQKTVFLTNIKPNINKLFDITGLNKVFQIK